MRAALALFAAALVACGGEGETTTAPTLPGDDEVLAVVEGGSISRYDLDRTVEETLGPLGRGLDDEGRRKALESLVSTRALALRAESELAPDVLLAIDRKAERYRDRLLTEAFVRLNSPPAPVTDDDVRDYYAAHPDRYRRDGVRSFEMLLSTRPLSEAERDAFLAAARDAERRADWRTWAVELSGSLPIAHRAGESSDASAFPERLRELIATLPVERASAPTFVDGRAFLVRIVRDARGTTRPLSEVRDEIRRAIEAVRLRESVRAVRESTLAETAVEYR